jgi:protein-S-isoprenylcysteine O-methyltransferase Ste14
LVVHLKHPQRQKSSLGKVGYTGYMSIPDENMERMAGTKRLAFIVVPLSIGVLCGILAIIAHFLVRALGLPPRLHLPWELRAMGMGVLALGCLFMGWVFKFRRPLDLITSTYVTVLKALKGAPPQEVSGRTEPLILLGPYRHVRNPQYFAVVVLWLGWWLLLDYTILLFMALLSDLWFLLVVTRFEERELRALFGEEYDAYARAVPKMLPSWHPKWPLARGV